MPEKGIKLSETKVHGLSVSYSTGEKRLVNCKGELKDTVTAKYASLKIVEFVKQVMSGDAPVILVAHNGNSLITIVYCRFLKETMNCTNCPKAFQRLNYPMFTGNFC